MSAERRVDARDAMLKGAVKYMHRRRWSTGNVRRDTRQRRQRRIAGSLQNAYALDGGAAAQCDISSHSA